MNTRKKDWLLVVATLGLQVPANAQEPSGPMTANEFRSAILSHLADLGYQLTDREGVLHIGPIKP